MEYLGHSPGNGYWINGINIFRKEPGEPVVRRNNCDLALFGTKEEWSTPIDMYANGRPDHHTTKSTEEKMNTPAIIYLTVQFVASHYIFDSFFRIILIFIDLDEVCLSILIWLPGPRCQR